jgi:hypothetical protein
MVNAVGLLDVEGRTAMIVLWVVLGVYVLGAMWIGLITTFNPIWEPMRWQTQARLAVLWPYHLVNKDAYCEALWRDFDVK